MQGVGFRPAVYRLATSLGLAGTVENDADGATIEVEGAADQVARFDGQLVHALPPLARLARVDATDLPPLGQQSFAIAESTTTTRRRALIPPDAMLCEDCRRDMETPADRRHHYPFTTCTNCGPRFSIALRLPYDRQRTSMASFPLCPDCRAEYTNPADRRFHAEPVCCPTCGPTLELASCQGDRIATGEEALQEARDRLARREILAIKGLGGFQIACRADQSEPVAAIRQRKRRPFKPFAVMARDLTVAREMVRLSATSEQLLDSPCSPIVLAPIRGSAAVAAEIAPGLQDVGVMLPTTPLHVELFRDAPYDALVMTSGNSTDEPIAKDNTEAIERLGPLVDAFLWHDRDVVRRVDDSVVRSHQDTHVIVRRSRGFTPEPVPTPLETPEPILALGGHLQNTACLALDGEAYCSQHVGDLDTAQARAFLREVVDGLEDFLEACPSAIACDMHPDYPSTWLAKELVDNRGGRLIPLQHHLAHAAAVLGEHNLLPRPNQPAAAIVLDGTGFAPDGTSWGGEILSIDADLTWRRCAHCEPLPLIGGEQAVRQPWRVALAALELAGAGDLLERLIPPDHVSREMLQQTRRLASSASWPMSSGAGRVFEAAGALFGLCAVNTYEGEAASRFEALADECTEDVDVWPERISTGATESVPTGALLAAAAKRLTDGKPAPEVARAFHRTFGEMVAELAGRVLTRGERMVGVSGGCMVNRLLLKYLSEALVRRGFHVVTPCSLPPGDGGLAYGQAVLAGTALAIGRMPVQEEA